MKLVMCRFQHHTAFRKNGLWNLRLLVICVTHSMLASVAPLSLWCWVYFQIGKKGKRGRIGGQVWKGYSRGDSMIWDFVSRRPLPVRDHVVSIKDGPKLWNHVSKVWRLLVWRNTTDEKLDVKISFFVIILPNMNSPNFIFMKSLKSLNLP